jgi:hypothetical protein
MQSGSGSRRRSFGGIARAGKAFWRWKSQKRAGRPKIDRGLRDLIQRMSKENPQWGASRIHGTRTQAAIKATAGRLIEP